MGVEQREGVLHAVIQFVSGYVCVCVTCGDTVCECVCVCADMFV